ncbi:MAG: response regulator [Candidatus Scalindua sp. AMX11]|nr:MAG: response regulator [Candidatus Scalindua sp.]NOG85757.1 response regulator [Planctomycetota bacterium]RZV97066.1 MAG: response regulator [Candidatus Scalindua sp. SCAELEC01]TDE66320.1 MAG: response regulator [Candidatus Scalindua sp. AMX11]GJQ58289.1 MAG: response regulator [Candidatus Scalindua sp.]
MSKVLLVDDSAVMRKIIQRNIKESGLIVHEFVEAGDGAQALEKVSANELDLILCDWNMPNMSGIEFVKNLRSLNLPKKIPVIMVTTEGSDAKKSEAKESGANDYITKPFTADQLRDTLGKYLMIN